MGARWLAVLTALWLIPAGAIAKGKEKEAPKTDDGMKPGSVVPRQADPGWAKGRGAINWQALGQYGRIQTFIPRNVVHGVLWRPRTYSRAAGFELRPLRRFDDVVGSVIGRLKAAANHRKSMAQKGLGDLADQAHDRENRP